MTSRSRLHDPRFPVYCGSACRLSAVTGRLADEETRVRELTDELEGLREEVRECHAAIQRATAVRAAHPENVSELRHAIDRLTHWRRTRLSLPRHLRAPDDEMDVDEAPFSPAERTGTSAGASPER